MTDDAWTRDENPYAAPQAVSEASQIPILRHHPGEALRAWRRFAWPVRRRVRFRGEYEFDLEWHLGLAESVAIDGQIALSVTNWSLQVVPKFEIPVFAGVPALLTVEVRVKLLSVVDAFRVRLDDRTLYAEGLWPEEPSAPP